MPSTYSSNAALELIATGEQSATWGTTTNLNLQIIDRMTNGVGTFSLSSTSKTINTSDSSLALSEGHYKVLYFTGSPGGTCTVTITPNTQQKIYIVRCNTSDGNSITLTQGSGTNVTVEDGKFAIVYCDGAGSGASVIDLTSQLNISNAGGLESANNLSELTDASAARTNLGLGTMATQASSNVTITGGSVSGITDITVADGGTGASDAATARTNLGLEIGTDVQAYDAQLSDIAALAVTDGNFIVGDGTNWVVESGDTALASLGVTATGTELNALDGYTGDTTDLNRLEITTEGTSEASKVVTADSSGDILASQEFKAKSYNETFATVSSSTNSTVIDCETANVFSTTLSENTTFTFSNPPATGTAYSFTLKMVQDSGGSNFSVTWPSTVKWSENVSPVLTNASNAVDILVFMTHDGGTNWYGFVAGLNME